MSSVPLLSPILNGGIQNINFVNGRVLTAEDLTAERKANLQRQRLLGTCIGTGVASGLEVTLSASSVAYGQQVVHVTAGLAVNPNGDPLQLATDTDVTLAATLPTAANDGGFFAPCLPPQTELTNPGIYILTLMPASGYQQQVAVAQLNSGGVATSCSSRFATAGVQFRLVPVTLPSTGTGLGPKLYALGNQIQAQLNVNASAAAIAPAISQFRNGLAHLCFGTEALAGYAANPFAGLPQASSFEDYGLIDDQRQSGLLTDCEVPLGLIYWSLQGIQFVDLWSVRRPIFPETASEQWPLVASRRRKAEALAIFLQFQDHVNQLVATDTIVNFLSSLSAVDYFFYLPAYGLIPLGTINPSVGFDFQQFFSGRTYRDPVYIEGAKLLALFQSALGYPPIDLSKQEVLWLYTVRENQEAINQTGAGTINPYMIFTGGHIGFRGDAQFDLNYWDYANFG